MKKLFPLILLAFAAPFAVAQDSTLEPARDSASAQTPGAVNYAPEHFNNVLIIPFEPKLYMSEIDREIAGRTGLGFQEIRNNFRWGLNNVVFAEMIGQHRSVSMLSEDPEVSSDLLYIYKSIGYKYQVLPEAQNEEPKVSGIEHIKNKVTGLVEPKKEQEAPGTRIEHGQLKTVISNEERYMHTTIINPNMLNYLSQKYEAGLFLFINQLDLKRAATDYRTLEAEEYKRIIKVHYTIFDKDGNEICGGAAKTYFSSNTNDMNRIVKGHFPKIARQMVTRLPQPALTSAEKDKRREEEKKASERENILQEDY